MASSDEILCDREDTSFRPRRQTRHKAISEGSFFCHRCRHFGKWCRHGQFGRRQLGCHHTYWTRRTNFGRLRTQIISSRTETIQFVNGRSMGCMCELNNQSRFWRQNEKVLQPNKQLDRHRTSKYASTTRSMCCTRSVWHLVPFANGVALVLPTIRNRFESWLKLSRRVCNNGGLVPEVAHGSRIVDGGLPQAPILNRPRAHVRR